MKLQYQPFIFLVCLITYLINFKRINESLIQAFKSPPETAAKKEIVEYAEQIEKFKKLYSGFSDEQLQSIIREGRHIKEAINAARQVLNERKSLHDKLS
ncbi:hypothetical protein [Sporocytophaga myxococcoides]|nr:hypothetical protein [Sporocytophaga myxococcoides]